MAITVPPEGRVMVVYFINRDYKQSIRHICGLFLFLFVGSGLEQFVFDAVGCQRLKSCVDVSVSHVEMGYIHFG